MRRTQVARTRGLPVPVIICLLPVQLILCAGTQVHRFGRKVGMFEACQPWYFIQLRNQKLGKMTDFSVVF